MLILGILLHALLVLTQAPQRQPETFASIEGVVVKAGTNTPIAGATVEVTGIAPRTVEGSSSIGRGVISVSVQESASDGRVLSYRATTNSSGKFSIGNVLPGTEYQIVAVHFPDYLPGQYGQRVPAVPGRAVPVTPGDKVQDLRLELTPAGTISGRVVDSRGQGVRNVSVELRHPWYLEGWRLLVDWNELVGRVRGIGKSNRVGVTRTNGRGEFSFRGLAPAQYYVRTNLASESTATPINLHAGATVDDVRISMPDSEGRFVRGTLVDARGSIMTLGQVIVTPADVSPLYGNVRIDTRPLQNGTFEATVPQPGRYNLIATARSGSSILRGVREIEVRNNDLNDVRIPVTAGSKLSGTIVFEGNLTKTNAPRDPLTLTLYPSTPEIFSLPTIKVSSNGAFSIENITAGDYRLEVLPILTVPPSSLVPKTLETAFVKSIKLDGRDILNTSLRLESAVRGTLQIVVSMNGGSIEGRVLDSDRKPVANVMTVAVPQPSRRQRGDLYRLDSTDDSGHFLLTGLAPGDYKIFAFERVEDGAWQDPEFIKLFEDRGKSVRIDESGHVSTEITLVPAWN